MAFEVGVYAQVGAAAPAPAVLRRAAPQTLTRPRAQDLGVVTGQHPHAGVPQSAQAAGRLGLRLEVVGERREAKVVQGRGEVGDVDADHELLADPDRLMAGVCPGVSSSIDRPVPEQVVVSVDASRRCGPSMS